MDFRIVMKFILECLEQETGPYAQRISWQRFERWILSAGRTIRGSKRKTKTLKAVASGTWRAESSIVPDSSAVINKPISQPVNVFFDVAAEDDSIWPLHIVDPRDAEQMNVLYPLLKQLSQTIMYYLDAVIFPELLAHQDLKLSTCGQELGGEILFGRRVGFSGTPSDILPVELGSCRYERGSDGKVIHLLSSSDIVKVSLLPSNWTATSVLEFVAQV